MFFYRSTELREWMAGGANFNDAVEPQTGPNYIRIPLSVSNCVGRLLRSGLQPVSMTKVAKHQQSPSRLSFCTPRSARAHRVPPSDTRIMVQFQPASGTKAEIGRLGKLQFGIVLATSVPTTQDLHGSGITWQSIPQFFSGALRRDIPAPGWHRPAKWLHPSRPTVADSAHRTHCRRQGGRLSTRMSAMISARCGGVHPVPDDRVRLRFQRHSCWRQPGRKRWERQT